MKDSKFHKKVLRASRLFLNGKRRKADVNFDKLNSLANSPSQSAYLSYQQGICEQQRGNIEKAISYFMISAEMYEKSCNDTESGVANLQLGKALYSAHKFDDACYAYIKAEKSTKNVDLLCEIKTCLSEARMASDTVYDTRLFIDPCTFMMELIEDDHAVKQNHFTRACLVAAQACDAINAFRKACEYCTLSIKYSSSSKDKDTISKLSECAELLCDCAAITWDNELISESASTAYSFSSVNVIDREKSIRIALLHALTLLRRNEHRRGKLVLSGIDRYNLDSRTSVCLSYCQSLCNEDAFALSDECISLIPKNNIDELSVFIESVVSMGFPEAAAELYKQSLEFYPDCRSLILRPYASLLYKLDRFKESAQCYCELAKENEDPVLNRAYSLASLRAGDIYTAEQQLLLYVDNSESKEEALSIAGNLSLNEGYSPNLSASLYAKLAALLEAKGPSSYETVDAYNRLGIALYRCDSPLEAEMNAFKKAAFHANTCEATHHSNIHAVILCNLAECYMRDGDIDKCFDTFNEADNIFSSIQDVDLLQYSSCLKFKADILLSRGESDSAVNTLQRAVDLLEPHSQDSSIARQLSLCRNALGTVFFRIGKPELEIPELTKAIELASNHNIDDASLSLLYSNRGEAYERTGIYDLMAIDYQKALSLSSDGGQIASESALSQAAKWLSIGRYKEDSMLHTDAIEAYKSALEMLGSIPMSDESETNELTAFAYYQLGNAYCHSNIKDFSSSLSAYSQSLSILERLPESPSRKMHLASAYDARAAFYEVFGEHTLAVHDFMKAEELRASLLSED